MNKPPIRRKRSLLFSVLFASVCKLAALCEPQRLSLLLPGDLSASAVPLTNHQPILPSFPLLRFLFLFFFLKKNTRQSGVRVGRLIIIVPLTTPPRSVNSFTFSLPHYFSLNFGTETKVSAHLPAHVMQNVKGRQEITCY